MSATPTVFMFSGQGSQYFHMGRELFEESPTFRRNLLELDDQARALTGYSIVGELYDKRRSRSDVFERLALTHPALFMVEVALARTVIALNGEPDYVLGSSLGALVAAAIAGCLTTEQALETVVKQAQIVESRCPTGTMLAVMGDAQLRRQCASGFECEIAAINFPSQFVVAGRDTQAITDWLRSRNVSVMKLPVQYAFHSRWIEAARDPFLDFLRTLDYRRARVPLICCARSEVLSEIPNTYFWDVARQPIEFGRTIERLEARGAYRYIDLGPTGSLATSLKYTLPAGSRSEFRSTLSPMRRGSGSIGHALQNLM